MKANLIKLKYKRPEETETDKFHNLFIDSKTFMVNGYQ